jgi:hypothetical protein
MVSESGNPLNAALTARLDGPYQWNGDIVNNLNGGKGTFFVNGEYFPLTMAQD